MTPVPIWAELIVAMLIVFSGLLVMASAIGFLRLPDFFLRMHPPALPYTLGNWCVALAATLYFSFLHGRIALHPLLIPVLLAITVPVTTLLLARVSLFRRRIADAADTPAALTPGAAADAGPPRSPS